MDTMMIDGVYAIQMPEDVYVSGKSWHEYMETSQAFANIDVMSAFYELPQGHTMDVISRVFCMMAYANCDTTDFRYFLEKPWKFTEYVLVAMGSLGLFDDRTNYDLEFYEDEIGNTICKVIQ